MRYRFEHVTIIFDLISHDYRRHFRAATARMAHRRAYKKTMRVKERVYAAR